MLGVYSQRDGVGSKTLSQTLSISGLDQSNQPDFKKVHLSHPLSRPHPASHQSCTDLPMSILGFDESANHGPKFFKWNHSMRESCRRDNAPPLSSLFRDGW